MGFAFRDRHRLTTNNEDAVRRLVRVFSAAGASTGRGSTVVTAANLHHRNAFGAMQIPRAFQLTIFGEIVGADIPKEQHSC